MENPVSCSALGCRRTDMLGAGKKTCLGFQSACLGYEMQIQLRDISFADKKSQVFGVVGTFRVSVATRR